MCQSKLKGLKLLLGSHPARLSLLPMTNTIDTRRGKSASTHWIQTPLALQTSTLICFKLGLYLERSTGRGKLKGMESRDDNTVVLSNGWEECHVGGSIHLVLVGRSVTITNYDCAHQFFLNKYFITCRSASVQYVSYTDNTQIKVIVLHNSYSPSQCSSIAFSHFMLCWNYILPISHIIPVIPYLSCKCFFFEEIKFTNLCFDRTSLAIFSY